MRQEHRPEPDRPSDRVAADDRSDHRHEDVGLPVFAGVSVPPVDESAHDELLQGTDG